MLKWGLHGPWLSKADALRPRLPHRQKSPSAMDDCLLKADLLVLDDRDKLAVPILDHDYLPKFLSPTGF